MHLIKRRRMNPVSGTVFDIQRFSVHDGPGVRSTVFLKGCPLSCAWCSNPESQRSQPEMLYFRHLCTGCGACVSACPNRALTPRGTDLARSNGCTLCGACAAACPRHARSVSGRSMSVEEVCAVVREDWRMYMQSGGGVTCGGGEALAQPVFLRALLTELHEELGFHTCLDSSGFAPWETLEALLPVLDLILLDIKHMDDAAHRKATGCTNGPILRNARELAKRNFPVIVRVPLIPGFNDDSAQLTSLGAFLRETGLRDVELMPCHSFGLTKYEALGKPYTGPQGREADADAALAVLNRFSLQIEVHAH